MISAKKASKKGQPRTKKTNIPLSHNDVHETSSNRDAEMAYAMPIELQQVIINTFSTAFPMLEDTDALKQAIQQVKGHLFNRDFSAAFGQNSYLQAYMLRWSAARALGYAQILSHPRRKMLLRDSPIKNEARAAGLPGGSPTSKETLAGNNEHPSKILKPTKVVCVGGGAGAEVVAIAAAYAHTADDCGVDVYAVDNADWSIPLRKLASALSTPPPLSPYASEAAKARPENQSLLRDKTSVNVSFIHQDALSWQGLRDTITDASLCSIMFTLNELFSASIPKTTSFLLTLTESMARGSHLLVVDSPGSYSEIQLGKNKSQKDGTECPVTVKKYPMKWLLDHTLLEVARNGECAAWEKTESEDSLWFRLEQKDKERLKYAVELENMRYQLHLYRRI